MANNRIFYSALGLAFSKIGEQSFIAAHGVQSASIQTTIPLQKIFELGQISVYENIEQVPDVEMTCEKVLDGYPLLYHLATNGAASPTLTGRSNVRSIVGLAVFSDLQDSASGDSIAEVQMSGMYPSSISYTFSVGDSARESLGLVGNHKVWSTTSNAISSDIEFDNTDEPLALTIPNSGGVQQQEDVIFDIPAGATTSEVDSVQIIDAMTTVLPPDIDGISSSCSND